MQQNKKGQKNMKNLDRLKLELANKKYFLDEE